MGPARRTEGSERSSFAKGADGRESHVSRRSLRGRRAEERRRKGTDNREDGDRWDGGTDDDDDDKEDDNEVRGWDGDGDVFPF